MELLNNIWNALSTPNEGLMNLLLLLLTFLEVYIPLLFAPLLNIETNRKQKLFYVIISFFCSIIATNFLPSPFNIFTNYLLNLLIMYIVLKTTILKSAIATISPLILFGLIGTLISNPYLTLLHISSDQIESIPIYRLGYLMIMYLLIFSIIFTLRHKNFKLKFLDEIDKKTKFIIFGNITLGIITLIIQAFIISYYIDYLPIIISFLSFVSLILYFIISIYSLNKVMKLTLTTKKLESAEEYNKTLRILHDSVRRFKHDFDNIVTTIGGYVKTNDMEGLKNYYVQLEDDCQKVNNLYLLNPEVINNPGIYNLLTNKYNEAISKDIKVNMSILLDLSNLKMKIYEFARILGILLDNAIEASQECKEKIINITFRNDEKNHRQLIIIENTYPNKDVDTVRIFGKGISEKENHTGLGLWEVQNILKKNNNISLFTTKTDKYFKQQLEIYY